MKRQHTSIMFAYTGLGFLFLVLFYGAYGLLGEDATSFLQWWFSLLIIGISFFPMVGLLFADFHDGGWLFSKTIGFAVSGWLLWYLSSIKFVTFTDHSTRAIVLILALINLGGFVLLRYYNNQHKQMKISYAISHSKVLGMMISELLFFSALLLWCYIRGFRPEAYGTEKFMDFGFMSTMMRTQYMPPEDMWFSGSYINYYYVGQYLATFLTKLSGVTVGYGYNLMMMTLAAFGFSLPYALVCNVMRYSFINQQEKITQVDSKQTNLKYVNASRMSTSIRKLLPFLSGILAGIAVCLAGNMHYPIYRYLVPSAKKLLGIQADSYWFPDATRYIGYHPETKDKTIHEFPMYSFTLGDLHAHVINLIFVLTILALLFAFLLYRRNRMQKIRGGEAISKIPYRSEILHPVILLIGFFIGLFQTTNFWDFPIYFVVAGAILLFSNAVLGHFRLPAILLTAGHAAVILAVAQFTALPFTLKFHQISTKVNLTQNRSPLYQLLVLWGLPCFLVLLYTVLSCIDSGCFRKKKNKNKDVNSFPRLYAYIRSLDISELFVITLGLCAVGLIIIPELVYVQDIYSGDYKRANTMFKLTYQAFLMFGICMGYMIVKLIHCSDKRFRRIIGVIVLLLFTTTVFYAKNAVSSWYGNIFEQENYQTLDASAFIEKESLDDYLATQWLNENVTGLKRVLEAQGDSYTYYQRISVLTGLPTIMGWKTHEWLWRSDDTGQFPASCAKRVEDVEKIYCAATKEEAKQLLSAYEVSFVYVGALEREKYSNINEEVLRKLGSIVFESNSTGTPSYLVKINYEE